MKNVRCAGGATADAFVWVGATEPCGWRGYRKPDPRLGVPTKTLPCPRCGGRVRPIQREARP